jgi:hypothetical protein
MGALGMTLSVLGVLRRVSVIALLVLFRCVTVGFGGVFMLLGRIVMSIFRHNWSLLIRLTERTFLSLPATSASMKLFCALGDWAVYRFGEYIRGRLEHLAEVHDLDSFPRIDLPRPRA